MSIGSVVPAFVPSVGTALSWTVAQPPAAALGASGIHAAVRFRSLAVGALEPPAVVASQAAYLAGFLRGLAD